MRIALVNMPWHLIDMPSLGLSILRDVLTDTASGLDVRIHYLNLLWAQYVGRALLDASGIAFYEDVSQQGTAFSLGDWLFSTALYGATEDPTEAHFARYLPPEFGWRWETLLRVRCEADEFIEEQASRLIKSGCDVVGLSSTFMQNVPCLALAKRLKQYAPQIITVMGGANCDGSQGIALHTAFPFLDYVIRGEGEQALPQLIHAIQSGGGFDQVSGLCYRDRHGGKQCNDLALSSIALDDIPPSSFHDYLAQLVETELAQVVSPRVPVESSRGCWWGERRHCTFCGLNGTSMAFRSKSAEAVIRAIEVGTASSHSLDVMMVDNILGPKSFDDLVLALARVDEDYYLHYEIKSNLSQQQLQKLRAAHVYHVQPGIESLLTSVLTEMRKGATAGTNIRCLRNCEALGIRVTWNFLYGFPNETESAYRQLCEQLPRLFHLPPPDQVGRIAIQRFSPYFNQPDLGFHSLRPAPWFRDIYQLPDSVLQSRVYLFEAPLLGINETAANKIRKLVSYWKDAYNESHLYLEWERTNATIYDTRGGSPMSRRVEDPAMWAVYRAASSSGSLSTLARRCSLSGDRCHDRIVERAVTNLMDLGLIFHTDDNTYIALGTEPNAAYSDADPVRKAAEFRILSS